MNELQLIARLAQALLAISIVAAIASVFQFGGYYPI
jgi:hypothetical protein